MTPSLPSPVPRIGAIGRLVAASARHPWLVIAASLALALWGWRSLQRAPLDALPDLSETQVIAWTEWPGQSPDLVEAQVTYPVSTALLAAPKIHAVRGQSMYGLSFVYAVFDDGTDLHWARSRVAEALAQLRLPDGARAALGPDASGVGWVLQYALRPKPPAWVKPGPGTGAHRHKPSHHDDAHVRLAELRAYQDFTLRYALQSVPGVAEVASLGGMHKQFEVRLDPARLAARGVGVEEVARALRSANRALGGGTIDIAEHEHVVRGRGEATTPEELASALVGHDASGPILVRDVADVRRGQVHARGVADLDGAGEVVGGIVIMRQGENALAVIDAVKQRLAEVSLPKDAELVITYDRSSLIRDAVGTLRRALTEEMIVVSLVIFLFLLHARSALIPVLTLPVAVLAAFVPMYYQGLTTNLMSLGGIVVAIGAMIDASIVMVENVHQRRAGSTTPRCHSAALPRLAEPSSSTESIIHAMQQVAGPVFFALVVTAVGFLPVFALDGSQGKLFGPLAATKTYSVGFAALLAVTLTPALAALLIRGRAPTRDLLNRGLVALYAPVVRFVIRRRAWVIGGAVLAMAATVPVIGPLGSELMPPLDEGAILYMPTAPHGIAMAEAARVLQRMDRQLREVPEVASVFGKVGRADTATDPAPMSMVESVVLLKPRDAWRPGMTRAKLLDELDAKLRYPGMPNLWWMPIQTRIEMLATGVRSPLGIQVLGDDLATLEQTAIALERAVAAVPGTRSAFAERASGGFFVDVDIKRDALVEHGVSVDDVLGAVATFGGRPIGQVVDGRARYDIALRFDDAFADDPQRLAAALVATPGGHVALGELATLRFTTGAATIHSEAGKLAMTVFVDTDRPIADYVADAQRAVRDQVPLPTGVRLAWAGQYESWLAARARLALFIPLALLAIVALLRWNTRSWIETGIVVLAVPFSLVGAFWLLWILGYHLSVAVWVGLVALAGLDAETGVVMLLYLRLAYDARQRAGVLRSADELEDAIVEGAAKRIRPKIMTVMTMLVSLTPVLWSDGAGADVMRRIAAPMVGGLVSSFALELLVYPAIYAAWKRRALR